MNLSELGKIIAVAGLAVAFVGGILILAGKMNISWLGRLPGDFSFEGKKFSFYFPLTTSLLISILLSVVLWLINRK